MKVTWKVLLIAYKMLFNSNNDLMVNKSYCNVFQLTRWDIQIAIQSTKISICHKYLTKKRRKLDHVTLKINNRPIVCSSTPSNKQFKLIKTKHSQNKIKISVRIINKKVARRIWKYLAKEWATPFWIQNESTQNQNIFKLSKIKINYLPSKFWNKMTLC